MPEAAPSGPGGEQQPWSEWEGRWQQKRQKEQGLRTGPWGQTEQKPGREKESSEKWAQGQGSSPAAGQKRERKQEEARDAEQ